MSLVLINIASLLKAASGSGVFGWETEEEEDIWEVSLDQICLEAEGYADHSIDPEMTVGELMEWRYLRAELEKEQVVVFVHRSEQTKLICAWIVSCVSRAMLPSSKESISWRLSDTSSHIK